MEHKDIDVAEVFRPYGTPLGDLPDPLVRSLEGLVEHVANLQARIDLLEKASEKKMKKNK